MKRFLMWFGILLIGTSIVLVVSSMEAPAAEKVIKWRMQDFMPTGSRQHKYVQDFCAKVKMATGGRLVITLYPSGALFPVTESFKNVRAGVAEIVFNYGSLYEGVIKEAICYSPPFGILDWQDMYSLWHYEGWKEIFEPHYRKNNMLVAAKILFGPEPIWSKVPIRSIGDFKGLKIRMSGAAGPFFHKYLGSSVTLLPATELYTAFKLGTIDAAECSGGGLDFDLGLHEVTKYRIMPYYTGSYLCEFLVNLKAYQSLPEDVRIAFDLCCSWVEPYITCRLHRDNEESKLKMVQKGQEVIWLPDKDVAAIRTLAKQYWDEQLASVSPDAAKLMHLYVEKAKEVGILK